MRYCAIVLHFYQPPTQEQKITKEILESCYLPLLRMLVKKSGQKITFNISGSLLVQLRSLGADEFFILVKQLICEGKVEILNSVMYHPLIPLTPEDIVIRQIEKNREIVKSLLGVEATDGFFPPELAVNTESLDIIKSNYIIVDETAIRVTSKKYTPLVKHGSKYLLVNNRHVCDLLRTYPKRLAAEKVVSLIKKNSREQGLLVMANDAELFGHHYSERLQVLADLLDSTDITFITSSEAVMRFGAIATNVLSIKASTWQEGQKFTLWDKSVLQKKYLQFLKTVYDLTAGHLEGEAQDLFDQGNSSCYLYWLSNWPWWHPDLVGKGAENIIRSTRIAEIDFKKKALAEAAYHKFLHTMWQYQWSGRVEKSYQKYNQRKHT